MIFPKSENLRFDILTAVLLFSRIFALKLSIMQAPAAGHAVGLDYDRFLCLQDKVVGKVETRDLRSASSISSCPEAIPQSDIFRALQNTQQKPLV